LSKVLLSVVTPVYLGAAFLDELVEELFDVRESLRRDEAPVELAEVVFVDDASSDGSAAVLERIAARHDWVRVVTLSRNYGQHPATVAGVLHTSGDWVATLDEDLQHPPRDLLSLLARAVEEGSDVVYAQPEGAVHRGRFRDLSSRAFKRLMSLLAGNPDVRRFNSFRMVRGGIARAAAAVATRETYFDIALCWFTRRIATLALPLRDVRDRTERRSGYNLRALLRHARRLLISSQIRPLRLGALIGLSCLLASLAGGIALVALKLARPDLIEVRGWTSSTLITFFFGGLIALLAGISLEYLSDLHLQALGRPTFFVVDRSQDALLREWLNGRR
jgi:polyisoprenyl-phosphate glycosyltransferase